MMCCHLSLCIALFSPEAGQVESAELLYCIACLAVAVVKQRHLPEYGVYAAEAQE